MFGVKYTPLVGVCCQRAQAVQRSLLREVMCGNSKALHKPLGLREPLKTISWVGDAPPSPHRATSDGGLVEPNSNSIASDEQMSIVRAVAPCRPRRRVSQGRQLHAAGEQIESLPDVFVNGTPRYRFESTEL